MRRISSSPLLRGGKHAPGGREVKRHSDGIDVVSAAFLT